MPNSHLSSAPSHNEELAGPICHALSAEAKELLGCFEATPLKRLMEEARALRDAGHGRIISYSRKVFVPLTRLCRDSCSYCTFAKTPNQLGTLYQTSEEVLAIARAGLREGCHEVLFTLGDKPEMRYRAAREALNELGFRSTVEYLKAMCALVLKETGLLPHINAGVMDEPEMSILRTVSASQGIMLESAAVRLVERGGPHFGSPDKHPQVRAAMIGVAGQLRIPFTTGILIGIGETRLERIESLLLLRELHVRFGHIQEIIVQNFRAKSGTRMSGAQEPDLEDLLWTAAVARHIFGPEMNIQVPPNLSYASFPQLLNAGISDWGGVSPVTIDHVNPEAPWPHLDRLERATNDAGFHLVERLPVYPAYVHQDGWVDPQVRPSLLKLAEASGFARSEEWAPGTNLQLPSRNGRIPKFVGIDTIIDRAVSGSRLTEQEICQLFSARDSQADTICAAADEMRARVSGNIVRYVVNRNINYTNVCAYKCGFCAFSKGKLSQTLRGAPYDLSTDEIVRRASEAWNRGATEVCMQGGINPHYTGNHYVALLDAVKSAIPEIHVHAFSPLEVWQGANSLGVSVDNFLGKLRDHGLGSLPGTAAEILDDEIRNVICPDKLTTQEWLQIVRTAHRHGLRTTATIMFGHTEQPVHWARHLLHIRDLQEETGGFTEFVPLPFVLMEAPLYLRGKTRKGPTWREVQLMHALARLVLNPLITNVQASWVKLGKTGVAKLLSCGVNDLGGTLMNESISRAAGTEHGQELPPPVMERLIEHEGRIPEQRTTLYQPVPKARRRASFDAAPLAVPIETPFRARRRNEKAAERSL